MSLESAFIIKVWILNKFCLAGKLHVEYVQDERVGCVAVEKLWLSECFMFMWVREVCLGVDSPKAGPPERNFVIWVYIQVVDLTLG